MIKHLDAAKFFQRSQSHNVAKDTVVILDGADIILQDLQFGFRASNKKLDNNAR